MGELLRSFIRLLKGDPMPKSKKTKEREHQERIRKLAQRRRGRVRMALNNGGWGKEPSVGVRLSAELYEPTWKSYRALSGWRVLAALRSVNEVEEFLEAMETAAYEWFEKKNSVG